MSLPLEMIFLEKHCEVNRSNVSLNVDYASHAFAFNTRTRVYTGARYSSSKENPLHEYRHLDQVGFYRVAREYQTISRLR